MSHRFVSDIEPDTRLRLDAARIDRDLDPHGTVARNRKAVSERHAWTKPTAEGMAQLSIQAPMAQTIAAMASLTKHAEQMRLGGDIRTKAQIIADTAIARLTCGAVQGCSTDGVPLRWSTPTVPCPTTITDPQVKRLSLGEPGTPDEPTTPDGPGRADRPDNTAERGEAEDVDPGGDDEVPMLGPTAAAAAVAPRLHLHLILSDQTLLGGDEPAILAGHGPIPAFIARHLAAMAADTADEAHAVICRYLTDPVSGRLTDCDPRARLFPRVMKEFLLVRDQVCRTPFCGSPIREFDHIVPYAQGGATTIDNGQGLCRRCNHAKEQADWHQTIDNAGTITTTTPAGTMLHSPEPTVPGATFALSADPISSPAGAVPHGSGPTASGAPTVSQPLLGTVTLMTGTAGQEFRE